jgi:hypothetical protein
VRLLIKQALLVMLNKSLAALALPWLFLRHRGSGHKGRRPGASRPRALSYFTSGPPGVFWGPAVVVWVGAGGGGQYIPALPWACTRVCMSWAPSRGYGVVTKPPPQGWVQGEDHLRAPPLGSADYKNNFCSLPLLVCP